MDQIHSSSPLDPLDGHHSPAIAGPDDELPSSPVLTSGSAMEYIPTARDSFDTPTFPPPPQQPTQPPNYCLTSPQSRTAAQALNEACSPVSSSITEDGTLYASTSPTSTFEKPSGMGLPTVQEIEVQSNRSTKHTSPIRRLLNARAVVLLLTYASPLSGLAALLFAVMHVVACFAILYASNLAPVAGWVYAPQVYLAVLTAISNKALAFAVVQGTVVTWWLKAMRGTTLAQLHYDWAAGLHVWQAMGAGRHFSVLAFACLCATFVAIDGPLLQTATSVRSEVPDMAVPLQVSMAPQMPAYFSGWITYPERTDGNFGVDTTGDFFPVHHNYVEGEQMRGFISGCSGTCTATIRAPALALESCETDSEFVDYTIAMTEVEREAINLMGPLSPFNRTAFRTVSQPLVGSTEYLSISTSMTDQNVSQGCKGKFNKETCHYASAIGEYHVQIKGSVVTFLESPAHPKILEYSNNTALTNQTIERHDLMYPSGGYIRTTLSGIAMSLNVAFSARGGLMPLVANDTPTLLGADTIVYKYMAKWPEWTAGVACAPEWIDPREDMVAAANELMFRAGFYTAQRYNEAWFQDRLEDGLYAHYNVTGTPTNAVNVFVTHWAYFAGAATLEIITISAILFTFFGWWRLNPERSLSPLEIAKAFDAPLLRDFDPDQKGSKIAKSGECGRVRYRVVQNEEVGATKRTFATF